MSETMEFGVCNVVALEDVEVCLSMMLLKLT